MWGIHLVPIARVVPAKLLLRRMNKDWWTERDLLRDGEVPSRLNSRPSGCKPDDLPG